MGGNILKIMVFSLVVGFVSAAEVLFYATDMSMRAKKEYAVNQQFLVHVIVKKISGQFEIQVPEVAAYGGRRTSVQMNTINGVSTIKHSYTISFNRQGAYSLGKARIVSGSNEFFSPSLEVVISDQIVDDGQPAIEQNLHHGTQKEKYLEPFSRLSLTIAEPFVKQQILCFLSFYYDDKIESAPAFRFSLPVSADYRMSDLGKPEITRETFNGNAYRCVRWPFYVTPLKSGEVSIEPFSIEYEYDNNHQSNFQSIWEHVSRFFDKRRSVVKVPKHTVFVHEVPLYQGKDVQAVGQFKSFKALVNPVVITEKDASTITLELVGNGNFEDIAHPPLAMIENISLYNSNNSIVSLDGFKKKNFEYIIQPYHSGNLEIPSQKIVTFDPIAKKHVVLQTDPQTIVVKALSNSESSPNRFSGQNDARSTEPLVHQEVYTKNIEFAEQFKIPGKDFWDLSGIVNSSYFFIIFIIILCFITFYFFARFPYFLFWVGQKSRRLFAYQRALAKLIRMRLTHDAIEIYGVFIALFSDRLCVSHIDFKYKFLQEKGAALCDKAEQKKWHEFCSAIAAIHFGVREVQNLDALFDEALFWVDQLKKKGL